MHANFFDAGTLWAEFRELIVKSLTRKNLISRRRATERFVNESSMTLAKLSDQAQSIRAPVRNKAAHKMRLSQGTGIRVLK